jgi:Protein of unknown function (DUF3298)/Deacetylase PdaC
MITKFDQYLMYFNSKKPMMFRYFLLLLITLTLINCKNQTKQVTNAPETIEFSQDSLLRSYGAGCQLQDSLANNCLTINNYFLIIKGNNDLLIKSVNDTLNFYIKNSLIGIVAMEDDQQNQYKSLSIDSLCGLLADMHKSQVADYPDAASNQWFIETYSDTTFQNQNMLSVQFTESTYLGGAHPNSFTNFLNFEKSTGKTIGFDDIVKDKTAFLKIAESAFRKNQELGPEDDLEEAGYFFEKGIFALPYNFTFNQDGIYLFFNPYEAGAYALGPIAFTIPYGELKDVLDLSRVK